MSRTAKRNGNLPRATRQAMKQVRPNDALDQLPLHLHARVEFELDWVVDGARRAWELEQYQNRQHAKLTPWTPAWWASVRELGRIRDVRISLESVQPFFEMKRIGGV